MLRENLILLRNVHGFSQEKIAEKVGVSRQAYAKWESGATLPDIEKCVLLAKAYGTTVDALVRTESVEGIGVLPPAPAGKNIWGAVTLGERGQIVIPKGARDRFALTGGERMIVVSDERGIALIPASTFEEDMKKAIESAQKTPEG